MFHESDKVDTTLSSHVSVVYKVFLEYSLLGLSLSKLSDYFSVESLILHKVIYNISHQRKYSGICHPLLMHLSLSELYCSYLHICLAYYLCYDNLGSHDLTFVCVLYSSVYNHLQIVSSK